MPHKDIERRREVARDSMRRARAKVRTARAVRGLLNSAVALGPIRDDSVKASTAALTELLTQQGLTVDRVIGKVAQKLDARTVKTIAGEREELDDNDAQLRAVDLALGLHRSAGSLPSDRQSIGIGDITINVSIVERKGESAITVLDAVPLSDSLLKP